MKRIKLNYKDLVEAKEHFDKMPIPPLKIFSLADLCGPYNYMMGKPTEFPKNIEIYPDLKIENKIMATRTNILSDFFNSSSDANEFLEAKNQEKLELDFQNWIENDQGELKILDSTNEMCIQSLSPEKYEMWRKVKNELIQNRSKLKKFDWKG